MILGPKSLANTLDDEVDEDGWNGEESISFIDQGDERDSNSMPKSPSVFKKPEIVKFGESGDATIVHVSCDGEE
jgi:hypothetical protein